MLTFNGLKCFCLMLKYLGISCASVFLIMLASVRRCRVRLIVRNGYTEQDIRQFTLFAKTIIGIGLIIAFLLPNSGTWAQWQSAIDWMGWK